MSRVVAVLSLGLAGLLFAAEAGAQDQKPVLLRYKFKTSEPLIYRSTQTTDQTQTINQNKIETKITNTDITIRKLEKIDKNKNLQIQTENKFLKVRMKVGTLGEYSYDSNTDDNEKGSMLGGALTPMYDALDGAILKEIVSPRGEVIEIKGFEELMAAALKDNPLGRQFAGGGSNKARKFGISELYPVMPKSPVKPGDTWNETFEIALPKLGRAKGTRKYTFAGFDKVGETPTAKITYTTDLTFKLNLDQGGQQATGELSVQKSSGTAQFDPANGRVVNLKSAYTIGGTINVTVNGMELTVETAQTQSVELNLLNKLPKAK